MENSVVKKFKNRKKRALRVRKNVRGTSNKPRLSVIKSNTHLYIQLIDDEASKTLASASTISKEFRNTEFNRKNRGSAKQLGQKIAEIAVGQGLTEIVFDRGPFRYHGVIAAVADGAREGGLKF